MRPSPFLQKQLQLLALPLARPRAPPPPSASAGAISKPKAPLFYLHAKRVPLDKEAVKELSLVTRATNKAADMWAGLGQAKEGTWKRWSFLRGERFMDRIEYEEWSLKAIDPALGPKPWERVKKDDGESKEGAAGAGAKKSGDQVALYYPPNLLESEALLASLKSQLAHREPHHKSAMYKCLLLSPLTWPFALIPVVPNFPLFYVLWRAWSHWRAWKASEYLSALLSAHQISLRPSNALETAYNGSEALTLETVPKIVETFKLSEEEGMELRRAVIQVEARIHLEHRPRTLSAGFAQYSWEQFGNDLGQAGGRASELSETYQGILALSMLDGARMTTHSAIVGTNNLPAFGTFHTANRSLANVGSMRRTALAALRNSALTVLEPTLARFGEQEKEQKLFYLWLYSSVLDSQATRIWGRQAAQATVDLAVGLLEEAQEGDAFAAHSAFFTVVRLVSCMGAFQTKAQFLKAIPLSSQDIPPCQLESHLIDRLFDPALTLEDFTHLSATIFNPWYHNLPRTFYNFCYSSPSQLNSLDLIQQTWDGIESISTWLPRAVGAVTSDPRYAPPLTMKLNNLNEFFVHLWTFELSLAALVVAVHFRVVALPTLGKGRKAMVGRSQGQLRRVLERMNEFLAVQHFPSIHYRLDSIADVVRAIINAPEAGICSSLDPEEFSRIYAALQFVAFSSEDVSELLDTLDERVRIRERRSPCLQLSDALKWHLVSVHIEHRPPTLPAGFVQYSWDEFGGDLSKGGGQTMKMIAMNEGLLALSLFDGAKKTTHSAVVGSNQLPGFGTFSTADRQLASVGGMRRAALASLRTSAIAALETSLASFSDSEKSQKLFFLWLASSVLDSESTRPWGRKAAATTVDLALEVFEASGGKDPSAINSVFFTVFAEITRTKPQFMKALGLCAEETPPCELVPHLLDPLFNPTTTKREFTLLSAHIFGSWYSSLHKVFYKFCYATPDQQLSLNVIQETWDSTESLSLWLPTILEAVASDPRFTPSLTTTLEHLNEFFLHFSSFELSLASLVVAAHLRLVGLPTLGGKRKAVVARSQQLLYRTLKRINAFLAVQHFPSIQHRLEQIADTVRAIINAPEAGICYSLSKEDFEA
ncbi:hypothetical protein MNV49_003436 [Pseudohyphozyma bogoriensis]|nr:hypothetical protein MNV49_003436 [Pseudohyphozyma bogoriensis]